MTNWHESLSSDIKLELDESLRTVDIQRETGSKVHSLFLFIASVLLATAYNQESVVLALTAIAILLARLSQSVDMFKANQAASQLLIISQLRQLERVQREGRKE